MSDMTGRKRQLVQYIPRLRRYARSLIKDPDRAEDLVQETIARALGKLHFWTYGSDMRAWLFTIMHNQYVNECHRAQNRLDHRSLDDDSVQDFASSENAEQDAQLYDIETALMRLPHEQRSVVLLVSLEGLSYAQTAKVLGIKQGTVMSRLHRARERLRHLLYGKSANTVAPIRSIK